MSYTIFPSEDRKYIVLQHWGEINGEIAMVRTQEAHRLGAELGITQYLVDLTEARNVDSIARSYKFAYKDAKSSPKIEQNMRVAMLVSPEDHSQCRAQCHPFQGS